MADRDSVHAPPAWGRCPSGPTPAWLSVTTEQLLLSLRATHAFILCGAVSPMELTFPGPQKLSLIVTATPFMLPPGTCSASGRRVWPVASSGQVQTPCRTWQADGALAQISAIGLSSGKSLTDQQRGAGFPSSGSPLPGETARSPPACATTHDLRDHPFSSRGRLQNFVCSLCLKKSIFAL